VIERIGPEVERELARFGPAAGTAELVAAWPSAVGATIARHAWPARLGQDGTLHVATESSVWAFELAQLAPAVLDGLRAALGAAAPERVRFAPGNLPEPFSPEATGPVAPPPRPGSREREQAEALTAGIGDDDLRELVARAAAASLARAAADR
jgi:hypothetical protein